MKNFLKELFKLIGENPNREGLKKTPKRFEEALHFFTSGYQESLERVVNSALRSSVNADLIIIRDIEFYSLCEHHLLPFFGRAHIAYLPGKHIIGLSKIPRIVDVYARRLQTQEHLTKQIADALMKMLKPKGIAVVLEAQHLCMMMRGVGKQHASVTTTRFTGSLRSDPVKRREFLSLLQGHPARRVRRRRRG